eukprot:TRINITY_DN33186_c0_g1_i1.p1 TRINITY_DN33186_c0_g1~~TRINITY_DN33186_c0_g1_i1.p1  ORF type:complete len:632 (+),score=90.96 TRINITY_DN33186_c0_g1_i1:46-1941(+)
MPSTPDDGPICGSLLTAVKTRFSRMHPPHELLPLNPAPKEITTHVPFASLAVLFALTLFVSFAALCTAFISYTTAAHCASNPAPPSHPAQNATSNDVEECFDECPCASFGSVSDTFDCKCRPCFDGQGVAAVVSVVGARQRKGATEYSLSASLILAFLASIEPHVATILRLSKRLTAAEASLVAHVADASAAPHGVGRHFAAALTKLTAHVDDRIDTASALKGGHLAVPCTCDVTAAEMAAQVEAAIAAHDASGTAHGDIGAVLHAAADPGAHLGLPSHAVPVSPSGPASAAASGAWDSHAAGPTESVTWLLSGDTQHACAETAQKADALRDGALRDAGVAWPRGVTRMADGVAFGDCRALRMLNLGTGNVTTIGSVDEEVRGLTTAGADVVVVTSTRVLRYAEGGDATPFLLRVMSPPQDQDVAFVRAEAVAAVPGAGRVLVADAGAARVFQVSLTDNTTDALRLGDGVWVQPVAVAVAAETRVAYVADAGAACVRAIDLRTHAVTTAAGQCRVSRSASAHDIDAGAAGHRVRNWLQQPVGVHADVDGSLIVVDRRGGAYAVVRVDLATGRMARLAAWADTRVSSSDASNDPTTRSVGVTRAGPHVVLTVGGSLVSVRDEDPSGARAEFH